MIRKRKKLKTYKKVVNEIYPFAENRGGGRIKIEAWEVQTE